MTDWLSRVTGYTYDDADRLTSTTLGDGLISDRAYDNADRLAGLVNRNGGITLSSYTYTLDGVGNRSQVVDTTGTTSLTYDGLYRLTGVTYPNADTQSYTYDAQGNRLTKVHNGTPTSYSYDDADQMTLAGGVAYTYDADGNQTAAGTDTFSWDAENRMTASNIGGVSGSYAYDGAGLRRSRTLGGTTVTYAWDLTGSLPNVLRDSAGNRYVYGLDLISRTDGGGNQEYYLTDGLGSTTGLADGAGSVTDTYGYDVYGAVRTRNGTSGQEFTFTGEQVDATGLQYLRARYYDAATGRFASRDPLPFAQRYAYVGGNPVNLVDPCGLFPCPGCGKVKRAATGVGEAVSDAADCLTDTSCSAKVAERLDEFSAYAANARALITNGTMVVGCAGGIAVAGLGGLVVGCLVGKGIGEIVTQPLNRAGNVASVFSTIIGCSGRLLGDPYEGGGLTWGNAGSCAQSAGLTALGFLPEANINALAADGQYYCVDKHVWVC